MFLHRLSKNFQSLHEVTTHDSLNIANAHCRRDRVRGTICFFFGIFLVLIRWGMLGMIVEGFGFLNLFGNFLPIALTVSRQLPGLSIILNAPVISHAVDYLVGKTEPKYSV